LIRNTRKEIIKNT